MKLSVIIPVFNEEGNLAVLFRELDIALSALADVEPEVIVVDDGSRDRTWEMLCQHATNDPRVRLVRFSRNFGSQAALMAGFQQSSGDAVSFLAADLQEPPEILSFLLAKWREGYEVVWGCRDKRDDPPSIRWFSYLYWKLLRRLALPNAPAGGVDLCLVSRAVVDAVTQMHDKNTAVFGLIMWSGFNQTFVPYQRQARRHGKSKWTLGKKLKLFIDGFVSFSFFPIRLVSYLGLSISAIGFFYALVVIVRWLMYGSAIVGWPALMVTILTLSGVQLLMLGIVAEYLWRTFDESRNRPPYIIKELIGTDRRVDENRPNRVEAR